MAKQNILTRERVIKTAKPILFNTDMVRAIQDNRKTVTRRVAFPNKDLHEFRSSSYPEGWWYRGCVAKSWSNILHHIKQVNPCKYEVGDVLYVRETWCPFDADDIIDGKKYAYKADSTSESERIRKELGYKWKPSIHMPKWVARIFLRVTDVRVERLQDITDEQAIAESAEPFMMTADVNKPDEEKRWKEMLPALSMFPSLWNSTVKKSDLDKYGWAANPWVWVIEFERIEVE